MTTQINYVIRQYPPSLNTEESDLTSSSHRNSNGIPVWGHGPQFLMPNDGTPRKTSEITQRESTTTFQSVSDMGHGKWVKSLMVKGADTNALKEAQDSPLVLENVSLSTVWNKLMEAHVKPAIDFTGQQAFIPLAQLLRILSPDNVHKLLSEKFSGELLNGFADEIYGKNGEPKRIKIMATLVLTERLQYLPHFVHSGVEDSHLPLRVDLQSSRPILYERGGKRIEGSDKWCWSYGEADYFIIKQMGVCALFCTIDEGDKFITHFRLPSNFVLPFIAPEPRVVHLGGFGIVTKVYIEPSHVWYCGKHVSPKFLAIKSIQYVSEHQDHPSEAEALARRLVIEKPSDREHLHQLLFSFRRADFYYFAFEWAEGDLTELWKKMPNIYKPNVYEDICWFFQQCVGIVCTLNGLHNQKSSYTGRNDEEIVHVIFAGNHGRHGDIKPQNILWFEDYRGVKKNHLVIADLGLTQFTTTKSQSHALWAGVKGYTQTYKAPESDTCGKIGTQYDIWSLGCVFLEHISVFVTGDQDCVRAFSNDRLEEDRERNDSGNYHNDTFYNVIDIEGDVCTESKIEGGASQAQVKNTVKEKLQNLKDHELCPLSIRHFLDLIDEEMLVPDPSERQNATMIFSKLRKIQFRCMDDPEYACISIHEPFKGHLNPEPDSPSLNGDATEAYRSQILAGISGGQEDPNLRIEIPGLNTIVEVDIEGQTVADFDSGLGYDIYRDYSLTDDSSESIRPSSKASYSSSEGKSASELHMPFEDIEELIGRFGFLSIIEGDISPRVPYRK